MNKIEEQLYKNNRKRMEIRNLPFELTENTFKQLIYSNCYYCGEKPRQYTDCIRNGIDRVDNKKGYTEENTVTCCTRCNMMKRVLGHDEFIKYAQKIIDDNDKFKKLTNAELVTFYIKRGKTAIPNYIHQYIKAGFLTENDIHYDYFTDVINNKSELQFLRNSLKTFIKLSKTNLPNYESKINNLKDEQYIELYKEMVEHNYLNARRLLKYLGHDCKNIPKDYKFLIKMPKAPGLL